MELKSVSTSLLPKVFHSVQVETLKSSKYNSSADKINKFFIIAGLALIGAVSLALYLIGGHIAAAFTAYPILWGIVGIILLPIAIKIVVVAIVLLGIPFFAN